MEGVDEDGRVGRERKSWFGVEKRAVANVWKSNKQAGDCARPD